MADANVELFRQKAFAPAQPIYFEKTCLSVLPAYHKWFLASPGNSLASTLNYDYMLPFASSIVPLELTTDDGMSFRRAEAPLSLFLEWCKLAVSDSRLISRFYLAQAALSALPKTLQADLPTPELITKAGSGDIYDANLWMGVPPTYTPLHRDPNPNLFYQLAGEKIVRLVRPTDGDALFAGIQTQLGESRSKAFRGEEMMHGEERKLLDEAVWGLPPKSKQQDDTQTCGYEASLEPGNAIFIPRGWWHSIKGTGSGINASVNWWFR